MSLISIFIVSLSLINIIIIPIESSGAAVVFLFGDSLFDAGNNNYINTTALDRSNFPPYGQTYFGFPTGRFSDGRIIPDFISMHAGFPTFIPPYLQTHRSAYFYNQVGVNFASAGAGALLETFQGSVISLETQLRYHKRVEKRLLNMYGNTSSLSTALYLFSIGTNDYTSPYLITNSTHFNSSNSNLLVPIVIGNLTTAIKELHQRGARKFGFLNLGPLGCSPGLRILANGGCVHSASLLAKLHNKALAKALKNLANQLHGFRYSLYDFNHNLEQRIKHPSRYGYKQGKAACCGTGRLRGTFSCGGKRPVKEYSVCRNPKEYVFWDSYHLTERVHREMAHQMWNQPPLIPGTYNLKTLFQSP